jgi:uncharacterized protein
LGRRLWGLGWLVLAATLATGAACRPKNVSNLPVVDLRVGGHSLRAEVARNPVDRTTGLMFRTRMSEDEGMLFVFPDEAPRSFWMRNTLLPLSIAFLDRSGEVLNVEEMQPETENPHFSKGPAVYALEMNAGWFVRHRVGPGARVENLEKAPPAE